MPLKVTAAALSVLVHTISNSLCHFLKSQVTFTPVDPAALKCWERRSEATRRPGIRYLLMPAGNVRADRRRTARGSFCLAGKTAVFVTHSFPFFFSPCSSEFTERMAYPELPFCHNAVRVCCFASRVGDFAVGVTQIGQLGTLAGFQLREKHREAFPQYVIIGATLGVKTTFSLRGRRIWSLYFVALSSRG